MRHIVASTLAITLAACSGHNSAPAPARTSQLLTEEVAATQGTTARPVDGVVEAIDGATLSAQTSGRVSALLHDVGDRVAAGTVILRITSNEQRAGLKAADGALIGAKSAATESEAQFHRVKALYDEHIASKAQYEAALSARDRASAALAAAEGSVTHAHEQVGYTEIRAPFAGAVSRRLVDVGETVMPGQPLVGIVSGRSLRVAFAVPASIADAVRRANEARIPLASGTITLHPLTISPEAGADTGTFRARANLPSGIELAPGTPVRVELPVATLPIVTAPSSALVRRSEVSGVYVVGSDGLPVLRYVRPGRTMGDRTEILAGLAQGDVIATDSTAAARAAGDTKP